MGEKQVQMKLKWFYRRISIKIKINSSSCSSNNNKILHHHCYSYNNKQQLQLRILIATLTIIAMFCYRPLLVKLTITTTMLLSATVVTKHLAVSIAIIITLIILNPNGIHSLALTRLEISLRISHSCKLILRYQNRISFYLQ